MSGDLDAEWDAINLDAEWDAVEPAWLTKSKHKQNAARAQVEADDEFNRSTGERLGAAAMGAASTVAPPPTARGSVITALTNPLGLVLDSNVAAARHFMGTDDEEAAAAERNPAEFGVGQALGHIPTVIGSVGAAKGIASAGKSAGKSAGRAVGAKIEGAGGRLKAAGKELFADSLASGQEPTMYGTATRALRALLKSDAKTVAAADPLDDLMGRLKQANDPALYGAPDDAAPILTGAKPPRPLLKLLDPVEDVAPTAKAPAAPEPPSPRAAAVERLITEEAAPAARPQVSSEMDVDNDFMRQLRASMPEPAAPSAASSIHRPGPSMSSVPAAPATKLTLKQAVQDGVKRGVPLKALAKELGLAQQDIAATYKGAQLGYGA